MIALGRQPMQRLRAWNDELARHQYTTVQSVSFEGFTTFERLTPAQAEAMPRHPYPVGTAWGACWEYAWFAAQVTLPASCEGERIVFFSHLGGEQLVYVNGQAAGSIDKEHRYITLSRCARAGETFRLLIESYAGHGARLENLGPCPPECRAVPETPQQQCRVGESFLAIWNEDAYQLLMDVNTLTGLLQVLPDNSLRAQKVARALVDYTHIVHFDLPAQERRESFRKARGVLRDALACRNGSTAPVMWLIGQSHIDLAWLWPEEETWHKVARTYANQLTLMEEYPEFCFLLCEPRLMDMLRLQHPEVWQRVKAAFARGQIDPEGAFYVECDTNFPSGESLIRQLLRGKRWFREHFGVDSQVAWQPDTFGYTGALPQILKGLGIPYFATQKLLRADPECERFPYQNFIWEGIDGSAVTALSFFKSNATVSPAQYVQRWEDNRAQTENIDTLLYPFGYGDGGGPTRDMLESVRRLEDLEGIPRSHYGGLKAFFEETARQAEGNRWVGELYLSWHRGTYTVQRKTKWLAASLERALHEAEMLMTLLPPRERMLHQSVIDEAWDVLMFNQFHDVAGGVGIRRVHEEAEAALSEQISRLSEMKERRCQRAFGIKPAEDAVVVNTLPWHRRAWVGEIYAELPPSGAAVPTPLPVQPGDVCITETAAGFLLENSCMAVTIDRSGAVTAITDKRSGLPLMNPGQRMNAWRLYDNVQTVYDAWEMDRDWRRGLLDADFHAECRIVENTPQRAVLNVKYAFGSSRAEQWISLQGGERHLEFLVSIDWKERRRLLKVHFESNVLCDDALHEIQFGHVRRPCHASHAYAADRYESCSNRWTALCEEKRGFAILTDGIRGVSTDRGEIALSLLRAPLVPDDTCDRGEHAFRYAIMPFATGFADSGVVKAGYEFCTPVIELPCSTCTPFSGYWCDSDSIILETVKVADDGNGVILRLYESLRTHASGMVIAPAPGKWYLCDMAESIQGEYQNEGLQMKITLRPFEVKTLRFIPS